MGSLGTGTMQTVINFQAFAVTEQPYRKDSMSKLSFGMAGSGNWKRWFPDDQACALYERIYPHSVSLDELTAQEQRQVLGWEAPGFVRVQDGAAAPLIPVFAETDQAELASWFTMGTERAVAVIQDRIGEYRDLADVLSVGGRIPRGHLLTILLCAHTLDVGTLHELQKGALGCPPLRAGSGQYFLWGTTVQNDDTCSFGVNSFPIHDGLLLSQIHSGHVQRTTPSPGVLVIPVLDVAAMQRLGELCVPTSRCLAEIFLENVELLEGHLDRCSFADCSRPDYLCMLFHQGYSYVAGALAKEGLLPAFPANAEDSWGLWVRPPL